MLRAKLTDRAFSVIQSILKTNPNNYVAIKEALLDHFHGDENADLYLKKLYKAKRKPGEKIVDYALRLQEIFKRAYPVGHTERSFVVILKQKFIDGLDSKLQSKVKYKEFPIFNELVAATRVYALRLESIETDSEKQEFIRAIDVPLPIKFQHELHQVENGTGILLMKTENSKYFRLLDNDRQLDFHLTIQPPCDPKQTSCTNRTTSFNMVGQAKLLVVTAAIMEKYPPITVKSAAVIEKAPRTTVENSTPSSDPELDSAANKQYLQDLSTDPKHERAIIAAQYNGWLAASLLKLPLCAKLQAFGQTAAVIQLKYSPCYWTNGFVNFNDKPYAFRNNTWKRIDPNIILPERTLAHSFRYEDVKSFEYDHRTAINEHPPSDFSSNHHPSVSSILLTSTRIEKYTSWWEIIKISLTIAFICIFILILLRIGNSIRKGESQSGLKALVEYARELLKEARDINNRLLEGAEPKEFDRQHEAHTRYVQQVKAVETELQRYLASHAHLPPSIRGSHPPPEPASQHPLSGSQLATLTPRQTEAQQRANAAQLDLQEAERALQSLQVEEDGDRNDWIDMYRLGLLRPPVRMEPGSNSAVRAELPDFGGKALEWFAWTDLFRALVHDTSKAAGEKFAILKRHLRGDCLDVVYGLGGGEAAYIQALVRLKENYGRRDVMRAAHIQALEKLEIHKNDPTSFKRYAEKVRTHLFDLTRIGETAAADIIERICFKLQLNDRLAWNADRGSGLETRGLNQFGTWLCNRAAAYQNAYSIAADQLNGATGRTRDKQNSRTNKTSTETRDNGSYTSGNSYCFKCEGSHKLEDCQLFKDLTIKERLSFCIRRRLCFNCFKSRHSAMECRVKKTCSVSNCRRLLHDQAAVGMIQLDVLDADGRTVKANVFLDEGSDSTLFREEFIRRLKLSGCPQTLSVDGAGGVVKNPVPLVDWNTLKTRWRHLADLPAESNGGRVDILLGIDQAHLTTAIESRIGRENEPTAIRTRLGWIMRRFCDTEDFGTEYKIDCVSETDRQAINILENGTRRLAVGYETPITWKIGEPDLPNNRQLAERRLANLLHRFKQEPDYGQEYTKAMEKNFEKGYAIVLEDADYGPPGYYLAHHGVRKGTKLRVVFDAAAPFKGKCLNDSILSGPALQTPLPSVILKFREGEIAWAADIEAMFSRIRLREGDARYFRFLWRRNGEEEARVLIEAINKRMYVDDYLSSAKSFEEGIEEAVGWISNSAAFLKTVAPASVLGVFWNPKSDTLNFRVSGLDEIVYTRAGIATPKKTISVPKLELNAALQAARLARSVQGALTRTLHRRYLWTDSSTVRNWIRATASKYLMFVSHRVGEIQTLTQPEEWRFVAGKKNPADIATRSTIEEEALPNEKINEFMKNKKIDWRFQPPRTPHFGGAHESLVRSAKRALYTALDLESQKMRHPTEDTLRTFLYEVAGLLNGRPLTAASTDPNDFRPLTPNDFMNRPNSADPPAGTFDDALPREHYRYVQRMANLFWDIWKKVYLQSLAGRKKWKTPQPNFKVGDIVLEIDKGLRRGQWNIGRIAKTFPGPDGLVRVVDVQLERGIFRRGIGTLALLESSSSGDSVPAPPASGEDVPAKS
ncbi:hypothetical protein GHT06_020249 [Daphnia sinensis]|uniref:DUF5641 domain-containing protein n=1 Tax=Daphnia sinensis TaxID=1820382 RepID=A0AAD5L2E4_9CRUS|nr:hypothetical protein GHT06_020249 [Daphnia sinensis]